MNYHKKLGDVLLDAGILTPNQIEQALLIQTKTKERLGCILIDHGYVSENIISEALEVQLGIPQIDLNSSLFDPNLVTIIPSDLVIKYQIIPVCRDGNRLILAMADPTNYIACDEIRRLTKYEIEPVIATELQILEKAQQLLGPVKQVFEVSDNAIVKEVNPVIKNQIRPNPRTRLLDFLLRAEVAKRANHIYIETQADSVSVRIRIAGKWKEIFSLSIDVYYALISRLKVMLKDRY